MAQMLTQTTLIHHAPHIRSTQAVSRREKEKVKWVISESPAEWSRD